MPSSTSWSTTAAVNVFETEANAKPVPVVIGTSSATSRGPWRRPTPGRRPTAMATEMPGMPVLRAEVVDGALEAVARDAGEGLAGVGVGVGVGCGASVGLGVGSGVSSGAIEAARPASRSRRRTGVALGRVVAPATAMLSGLRLGVANTPVDREQRGDDGDAAMPIPALERRTPDAPPGRHARTRPAAGGIGRACGERSRSAGLVRHDGETIARAADAGLRRATRPRRAHSSHSPRSWLPHDARRPKRRHPPPRGRSHGRRPRPVGQAGAPRRARACSSSSSPRRSRARRWTSRLVGKWLERVPELQLDGARPVSKDLQARLGAFWLPSQPIAVRRLHAGVARGPRRRDREDHAGRPEARRRPGSGSTSSAAMPDLRVWWAATDGREEYEDALLDAFAAGVPAAEAQGAALTRRSSLPWAVLRVPVRRAQADGDHQPAAARGQGARAGARDPDRRPAAGRGRRRPRRGEARPRARAPGRGTGRIASAAAFAAQGSPRKVHEPVYLSPEGLARLEAEHAELVAQRPDVIRRIATAREHGDLKENAEYHAAREEQGFLEGRIKSLEAKLKIAVVVAPTERGAFVELGSHVRVEVDGEETTMQVVSSAGGELARGPDLLVSPVGAALMGRKVGDVVTIVTPGGNIRYAVLEIS